MKEQKKIPVGKVARATRFMKTGARVGGNYVKYYSKKIVSQVDDREALHADNAKDIYTGLSELKGSALKVLQMMSMDSTVLPAAYAEQFALSQYSAPPLSYPLVVKTFQAHFGKGPQELFDSFSKEAACAASIGQVHKAEKDGVQLAVKVQYPGVAQSIRSDLMLVRPFAMRLFQIPKADLDYYMQEVEDRLVEETNYTLELTRSEEIAQKSSHFEKICFPRVFRELSSERILTMEWMEGEHLGVLLKTEPSRELRNLYGQLLWDFFNHQIHELRQVHADPHPGNFLFRNDGSMVVLDFGCVKVIPEDFYGQYFALLKPSVQNSPEKLEEHLESLHFLYPDDTAEEREQFLDLFGESIKLLGRPFLHDSFDFSNVEYFEEIAKFGEKATRHPAIKASKHARGPRDGLYLNRTFFGLYSLLHKLEADITITRPPWLSE
jgi:predicted unusual protein kinase regulating ubiquinone biosynthesis (AarF/ABC1/UbiB family)